jgi:NAD(P)-dependent dehydrogenase (short-subunit alcohol dehydrogenase family)
VVGFTRSYGKYLPEEGITLNSVCPNVIRTNISTQAFYDQLEAKNLLTPAGGVVDVFKKLLGASKESGECYEIGPNYKTQGAIQTRGPPYLDDESATVFDILYKRGHALHQPK